MNEEFMILVVLVFVGYFVTFMEKKSYNRVPKRIWTYWEDPEHVSPQKGLTEYAKRCIRSWIKHNPEYELVILTKKTYQGYVTIPEEIRTHPDLNPDHLVELIKLWILAERGGVWIDPDQVINRPFDEWIFFNYGEFAALIDRSKTTDQKYPVIDPSFMAANHGSEFMKRWRDEFSSIVHYQNIDQYIQNRDQTNRQKITDPIKDVILIAQQIVLQSQQYPLKTLILHKESNHIMSQDVQ